jgi:preprotein translocase subunit SecG
MDKGTPGLLRRTIFRNGRWIAVGSAVTVLVLVTGIVLATSRSTHASSAFSDGTTNFASSPTVSAELMSAKGGTLVIIH